MDEVTLGTMIASTLRVSTPLILCAPADVLGFGLGAQPSVVILGSLQLRCFQLFFDRRLGARRCVADGLLGRRLRFGFGLEGQSLGLLLLGLFVRHRVLLVLKLSHPTLMGSNRASSSAGRCNFFPTQCTPWVLKGARCCGDALRRMPKSRQGARRWPQGGPAAVD